MFLSSSCEDTKSFVTNLIWIGAKSRNFQIMSFPTVDMNEAQAKFTHATALIIHSWSALDIAVQNEWAGPDSSNKRDWLGGVVVDLFPFPPGKQIEVEDLEDLEELLLQILEDEFELRLEDDSAYQVMSFRDAKLTVGCLRYRQIV